jgi:lysophospholipase L1-like esterase
MRVSRFLNRPVLCGVVLLACGLVACSASAHDGEHEHAHEHAAAAPALSPAMVLPEMAGPAPWTTKPVFDDPERFQIAIMTDRTGGHRPGIWMDAVSKLNMLRPSFVMSVGDLIEGYTDDRTRALAEWDEFNGFIDQLDMKFFFVAGNHDVTNPMLQELWREKFGAGWYSFDYKRVHFLCLLSEDPLQRIGEEQLAFIRDDLAAHADARHTLVFLHKPLWNIAERELAAGNEDSTNWKKVEAMLADRPHTVFAGHVHHYVQYSRNGGRSYYSLATTGGSSQLRGVPYGEFDHVTWLTMEKDGPQVVNLKLDGILPPDVVTEEESQRFRAFLSQTVVEVAPILVDDANGFLEGDVHVRMSNSFSEPVEFAGDFNGLPLRGLSVDPERVRVAVEPGSEMTQSVRVRFGETIDFARLSGAVLRATLRTPGAEGLSAERLIPVIIDRRHVCGPLAGKVNLAAPSFPAAKVGGDTYATDANALVLGEASSWNGPEDGSFVFTTGHTSESFVIDVRVRDERIEDGDAIEFFIDPRPANERRGDTRFGRRTVRVLATPPDAQGICGVDAVFTRRPLENCSAQGVRVEGGYTLRIALPLEPFRRGETPVDDFLLAGMLHDVDDPSGPAAEILWRGSRSIRDRNSGYGTFVWEAVGDKWENDISAFEASDRESPPPTGAVLFVGSSSIRLWKLPQWLPDLTAINRGFGGSQIADVNRHLKRIVLPYKPSQIVFYAGDNDINAKKTPARVTDDFNAFVTAVRRDLPETRIIFVAIKPSLKRWDQFATQQQANDAIREICEASPQLTYLDVVTPMLGDNGEPKPELFADDGLHLNDAGYRLWTDLLKKHLAAK